MRKVEARLETVKILFADLASTVILFYASIHSSNDITGIAK